MAELSAIFALSDAYVNELAALDPYTATAFGIPGYDHLATDYSPDAHAARNDHAAHTLAALARLEPRSAEDQLAKDFLTERLGATMAVHESGDWMRPLRAFAAPVTRIRSAFDLMSRDGDEAWSNIAERAHAVPAALESLRASLEVGRAMSTTASRRQVGVVVDQCTTWSATRWFDTLRDEAGARTDLAPQTMERLTDGVQLATEAYAAFAEYLRDDYIADAIESDACGAERHAVSARVMLGAELDPNEMYEWAWTEHDTLRDEILRTCAAILPGASFAEVCELLETDPARAVHGEDAYRDWLQQMTDDALTRAAEHFDIPAPMNRCEACLPPAGSAAAAYYTAPSEDFSRPGRTWYPTLGRTSFPMWGDVTTCYHESVPGHHLQIAYAQLQGDRLSRFQRLAFVPGHGEGWALYAERLCDELGWFDNPDHRLGFLCGQQLRAVRVIVDIGLHLQLAIPEGTRTSDGAPFHGGETWTPELALEFAMSETGSTEEFMRSEIDRYLGWPAQAISYKVGEREWLRARAEVRGRLGDRMNLRDFHTFALRLGPVGLAQLRSELARFDAA